MSRRRRSTGRCSQTFQSAALARARLGSGPAPGLSALAASASESSGGPPPVVRRQRLGRAASCPPTRPGPAGPRPGSSRAAAPPVGNDQPDAEPAPESLASDSESPSSRMPVRPRPEAAAAGGQPPNCGPPRRTAFSSSSRARAGLVKGSGQRRNGSRPGARVRAPAGAAAGGARAQVRVSWDVARPGKGGGFPGLGRLVKRLSTKRQQGLAGAAGGEDVRHVPSVVSQPRRP